MTEQKPIKALTYWAGFFVVAASLLLAVFLLLTALGLLHPRQQKLILSTLDVSMTYDGTAHSGSEPILTYGTLHEGHYLEVLTVAQYIQIGQYENAPTYRILDESGADVTSQYDIETEYGTMTIEPRSIIVTSPSKSKVYDGTPLTADPVQLGGGSLLSGHILEASDGNSLILPGEEPITSNFRIKSQDGTDVTAQYYVIEHLGQLTVKPIAITVSTASADKVYDGNVLTAPEWEHTTGILLQGHTLDVRMTAQRAEVGTTANTAAAQVLDAEGKDVSHLYEFIYQLGDLKIQPIPLHISTMSQNRVYDGTPLSCPKWELTGGALEHGAIISVKDYTTLTRAGFTENVLHFLVTDENGRDITDRYDFQCIYGTLRIQPRAISIRTGSAEKVYDGLPLTCNEFEITYGNLCEGEELYVVGASIVNPGYAQNYVIECFIYRKNSDGSLVDVSDCYRISMEYGTLTVTAN